ncbi:NB-ARC domain-containing protein [Dolichospermum planctonicum CS-1226]|uniref:NB-ARC domain-containing protein n=1 Tax=Dolichospermum planctonicum CS-1226 TaxID=3021751 RepID=A0ABT5ACF9_9CYAN|nr:ATP-binding protein [Dolichospermum planctonicum]MDB9534926.1 NB-ARC domain-containing protein [Dolichospermum planctonicum CS-1226]
MNVNEVVTFVDKIIFEKTGKHLDDVQAAVVQGTWERRTYDDIAQECNVTKNHVGDIGAELWQLLSQVLNEDIKKTNFRSTFERLNIESSQNICIGTNHNFNFSSQTINHSHQKTQETNINTQSKLSHHDLTLAPQIIKFHNREKELQTLNYWILNQTTNLISILGLSGIGKTTLVKRFIDLHQQKFEVIIWRSLKFPKSLNLLINDLLNTCQQQPKATINDKLKQLFDILTNKKCLIILDDVQNIFTPHQFAGKYQPEYQDYQTLFKMITETQHQSHLILISQEQCPEMESLDEELYPIKSLELSGLENIDILKNTGLKDEDTWLNLMILYTGHPLFLKTITISIKKIFNGKVSEFLAENELVITQEMQSLFSQIFNIISPIEQQIILALSKCNQPVSREYLKITLELSSTNFINGLESLQKRYLIQKITGDNILFDLSPIFREYVRNFCQN